MVLTSAVPSTSNTNGRLRCHRHLGLAHQSRIAPHGQLTALQSLLRPPLNDQPRPYRRPSARAAELQPATNFDHLVAQSVELQSMMERARPRITEAVSAAVLPFTFPVFSPPATSICA